MSSSRIWSLASAALLAAGAAAQSVPYTDAKTGIAYTAFTDTKTGFMFGIATPSAATTDFMGFLTYPLTAGAGWGGISLGKGGRMAGPVLVVAWPNDGQVVSGFRQASGYTNPGALTGEQELLIVPDGTYANETHVSLTYLCKNCIDDELTFPTSANITVMGYALSATAPETPSDPMSALGFHSAGFGQAGMSVPSAASADYDTWAALATGGNVPTPPTDPGTGVPTPTNPDTGAPTATTTSETTYDAIIVGGGTSGIIVGARLAEAGQKVLVVERGSASVKSSGGDITVPWSDNYTVFDIPALNYNLNSLTQADQWLCTDTASMAGCLLGGSSSINGMIWVKASTEDYTGWPTGWSWADMEPVAEKVYAVNPGTEVPSLDGKLYDQSTYDALSPLLLGAGWRNTSSINDIEDKKNVIQHPPLNVANGIRSGPVQTYLPNVRDTENFELMLDTYVVGALRTGSAITGIEIRKGLDATIINVNMGGKVIFAGGALGTPRLLFNTGIGPKEQLDIVKAGSTFVTLPEESAWIDLPVGEGVRNHALVEMLLETTTSKIEAYAMKDIASAEAIPMDVSTFLNTTSGLFTQTAQRATIYTTVKSGDGSDIVFQGSVSPKGENKFVIKWYMTRGGKSSGTIGITAAGATEFTKSAYLNDENDKAAFVTMLDDFIALLGTQTDIVLSAETLKTGAELVAGSEDMANHWNGGAALGETMEGLAVVDTNTKVWGTDNLYVVDASVFVTSPAGNTVAPVMIAAEMAAIKILAAGGTAPPTTDPIPTDPTTTDPIPTDPSTSAPPETTTTPTPTAPSTCAARRKRAAAASRRR